MNLAQALLRALEDHGAREIFGIPGDFAMAFFRVVEESAILPLYTLSHEPGVGFVADDAPIAPGDIAAAVNELIDAGHRFPIAADMGDCLFAATDIQHTAPVAPAYFATMGFGVPAGLGVQATLRQRPLVLVGDGAFQMTGRELGNYRRYGFDPIVVVFNDRSWEMLHTFQPGSRFTEFDDWHFADAAAALGGDGVRVRTRRELRDALSRAAATRGRFQLIEAMLPRGVVSPTLARFIAGSSVRRHAT